MSQKKTLTLTSLHLFAVLGHVVRSDGPQELNVVITVVFGHLLTVGFVWSLETDKKVKGDEHESDTKFLNSAFTYVCKRLYC